MPSRVKLRRTLLQVHPYYKILKEKRMTTKKQPSKPADQNATYDQVMEENRKLKELNVDLHGQLTEMRKSKTISPTEEADFARLREDFRRQNEEVNAIALWLRDNKATEIKQGKHIGLKLSEICIMYMGRNL